MNIDWSDVTDIRDLIVNLRAQNYDLTDRAADEIERLREEVARLKAVQAPAKVGEDERRSITDEQIEAEARLYSLDLANGLDWCFDDSSLKAFVRSLLI